MSETYDWNSKVPAKVEEREFQLPPIGEYNFMVMSAEKTFSSNGNPMIKVRLDLQGAEGSVFDNLVISDKMMWKLVTFFESIVSRRRARSSPSPSVMLRTRLSVLRASARSSMRHTTVKRGRKLTSTSFRLQRRLLLSPLSTRTICPLGLTDG